MDLDEDARARTGGSDTTAILARVEEPEHRQAQGEKLAGRALTEEVARVVQSIGIVVDHLARRGLIDKADQQCHVARDFQIAHCHDPNGPDRRAIDVYGWRMRRRGGACRSEALSRALNQARAHIPCVPF